MWCCSTSPTPSAATGGTSGAPAGAEAWATSRRGGRHTPDGQQGVRAGVPGPSPPTALLLRRGVSLDPESDPAVVTDGQAVSCCYMGLTSFIQLSIFLTRNPSFWWHFGKNRWVLG